MGVCILVTSSVHASIWVCIVYASVTLYCHQIVVNMSAYQFPDSISICSKNYIFTFLGELFVAALAWENAPAYAASVSEGTEIYDFAVHSIR